MASLQRYSSHGHTYWRIVESYRRPDGHPAVRTLMHLGKADDLLARLQAQQGRLRLRSLSSGAVDALWRLALEFDVARLIDRAITDAGGRRQMRDGLTVGQSLVAAAIARVCHPASKRAFAAWAAQTTLPGRLGVAAAALTSQHFWDQMDALPVAAVEPAEEAIVQRVLRTEPVAGGLVAYDTTNFFTYIATTNPRAPLAGRGQNKQHRHDLRQLGLALVVSEEGQLPLGHVLYAGARPDVRTFAQILAPLRARLRRLVVQASQLTFVFDQGAESQANLAAVRAGDDHYVTALKPSHHRRWLQTIAGQLQPLTLATGEEVRVLRTRRPVHGQEHTVVVLWSPKLYAGQRRGLEQHLQKALQRLARISRHPRGGVAGARAQVARICDRQYVRDVLHCTVEEHDGQVRVLPHVDPAARARLEERYFGLRLLATTRDDWTTEQILDAYRGQARAERAFRDLKDPWVCAFRPQYHWTDQKLVVHAFIAVLALLLGRVVLRRAQQRAGFRGTLRTLIQHLAQVRTCTVVQLRETGGRPRVVSQPEDCDQAIQQLAAAVGALPG